MSAKTFWQPPNTKPTKPLGERIKGKIIDLATGPILARVVLAAVALTGAQLMKGWAVMVERVPGLEDIVSPYALADVVSQFVVAILLLLVAKWTGKPVRELQKVLREKGVYGGREDGYLGPRTESAIRQAVNDPAVTIITPKPVEED
jgi:hypothetical protein